MSRFTALRSLLLALALVVPTGLVSQAAPAATGTALTLGSSVRGPLTYGGEGHYKARLKTTSGKRLGSRKVNLWGRTVGTTTWRKLGSTRTMKNGLGLFTVPGMTSNTELQARFRGGSGYARDAQRHDRAEGEGAAHRREVSPEAVFSGTP